MKKIAALVLALILALSCISALAEETFQVFYSTEDLAGITEMNGFFSGVGLSEKNVLTLKDDGAYEYIKFVAITDADVDVAAVIRGEAETEQGYALYYIYTGTYTREGDQVTLNVPETCEFSECWGPLVEMGYMKNSGGTSANGDRVCNYEGTDFDPMDNFSDPVYKFIGHDTPVSITLKADGTFSYNVAASSDDD